MSETFLKKCAERAIVIYVGMRILNELDNILLEDKNE